MKVACAQMIVLTMMDEKMSEVIGFRTLDLFGLIYQSTTHSLATYLHAHIHAPGGKQQQQQQRCIRVPPVDHVVICG
jgi:hypothetical protein